MGPRVSHQSVEGKMELNLAPVGSQEVSEEATRGQRSR